MSVETRSIDGQEISRSWKRWVNSEEGQTLIQGETSGEYLRNRLERAFHAGIHAAEIALANLPENPK